jgi:hypothetical protein
MPRGKTTNWKRMVLGDSFGTSSDAPAGPESPD